MKKLTQLQFIYLKKVCFLLFLQLIVLLSVVALVHKFFPKRVCFMTCHKWTDLLLYMIIIIALIMISYSKSLHRVLRFSAFFSIAIMLAYLLALQYNIISILSHNDRKTIQTFFRALIIVVSIFIINLFILPFTMNYMGFIYTISTTLFICLVGLIIWGLFVGEGFLTWVSIGLFVFLGLLLTDLNILVHRCKKPNSVQCDPLDGASLLFVDLVNILQQIFILMNGDHR